MSTQLPPPSSMSKPAAGSTPTFVAAAPTGINMAQNTSHNMSQFINNSFQQQAGYSPPKAPFNQAYQHIPGIQSLPASAQQPVQPSVVPPVQPPNEEKPQSNGTTSNEIKENHVIPPQKNSAEKIDKDKVEKHVPEPAEVPQVSAASSMTSSATTTLPVLPATLTTSPPNKAKDEVETKEPKTPVKEVIQSTEKLEKSLPLEKSSPTKVETKPKPVESCKVDTTSSTSSGSPKTEDKPKHEEKVDKVNKQEEKNDVDTPKPSLVGETKEKKEECQKLEAQSTTADVPTTPPTPQKPREQSTSVKSPMKVATTPRTPQRKSRTPKAEESPRNSAQKTSTPSEPKPSTSKSPGGSKAKRARMRTQHYQSPLPEDSLLSKISQTTITTPKSIENKLIVFYKNEFLAVRNSEGGFFVCQAVQNVYKSSSRIKIRWLSQDKNDKSGEIYTPDFYDFIDFECILTNLELSKVVKGKFRLPAKEHDRTDNILKKAIAVEKGEDISLDDSMTEDNPDGLDVSLYTEEDQLMKKGSKRKLSKGRLAGARSSQSPRRAAKESSEPPEKTPIRVGRKPAIPATEPKRSGTAGGRAERAKRRSAPDDKTSPVIDNKKAKVLAKVVKRTASAPPKPAAKIIKGKETKPSKQTAVVASTSKAKTPKTTPPPAPTRKTPKRGRK